MFNAKSEFSVFALTWAISLFGWLLPHDIFLGPDAAQAQIYNCSGKWTNKPCSGEVLRTLEEQSNDAPGAHSSDPGKSEKSSLFHKLTMKAIEARREFKIDSDLSYLESLCFTPQTTVSVCREEIGKHEQELDKRIAKERELAAQQRAVELQQEANKLAQERNEIEAEKPNVTVVEENYYVIKKRYRRPGEIVDRGTSSGAGVSISASGVSSSGTRIGVEAQAGTSMSSGESPPIVRSKPQIAPRRARR
jgi:hypothetical protein